MGQVWFIGAGPGAPDLITLRGARLIAEADLVLYAGSLVPPEVIGNAKFDATLRDSSSMTLEETHGLIKEFALRGQNTARVHTGDPALYGALLEQTRLLDRDGIPWSVVPGVSAAFATAAAAGQSITLPEVRQTLIITHTARLAALGAWRNPYRAKAGSRQRFALRSKPLPVPAIVWNIPLKELHHAEIVHRVCPPLYR